MKYLDDEPYLALMYYTGDIMGGTIVEDVLTGGAGIADDLPSLGIAGGAAALVFGI